MSVRALSAGRLEEWLRRAWAAVREALGLREGNLPEDLVDERALLERFRSGGTDRQEAFEELVKGHQSWLVSFLTVLLASSHEAQDVAQEVLLRAYLAMDRFRGESRFRTWLTRIALNQAHNHRRRRGLDWGESRAEAQQAVLPFVERDAVLKTLANLNHLHREILVLRYFEELEVAEMAEQLEIGLSAAKMRLKRARDEFAEVYEALTRGGNP